MLVVGVGCSAIYYSSITIVQLYFKRYRGIMLGFTVTGGGLGTAVIPILIRGMLNGMSWRWTLVVMGLISLSGVVCGLAFRAPVFSGNLEGDDTQTLLRSSTPPPSDFSSSTPTKQKRLIDFTLWRNPAFVMISIHACMYMIGYIITYTFLPLKAIKADGVDPTWAAFLVSAMGLSGVLCRLPAGWLSDKGVYFGLCVNGLCVFIAGLASLMMPLWQNYTALLFYSIVYGAVTGKSKSI